MVPADEEATGAAPDAAAPRPGGERPGRVRALRRSAAVWRGRRPFWGGLLVVLAGAEILLSERASPGVILHIGMQGLAGYLIPAVLLLCGLLLWFNPAQRVFYSILSVLLSLGSWLTSNLGGFFVGLLLGLAGGCLAFGWLPDQEPRGPVLRRLGRRGRVPGSPAAPAPSGPPGSG